MFRPEGVYVAMLTPFDEQGRINEPVLRRMVDFQIEKGVHGLFPVSSVGEFIHLNQDQRMQLAEIVVDQARGRVPVTPGVSNSCAENSVILARHAQDIGCAGVVVSPPYYFPASQEIIEKHYEVIADSVDLPIILYNIPLFSSPISYDVVKRLSRRENIVAMKDSSGSMVDLMHFLDKVRLIDSDLNVLVGREEVLFPALMVGCKGCMVATAGIVPEVMVDIYRSWQNGNYQRAQKLQFDVLQLIRACFALPLPVGFKVAMELRGFLMGPLKQPLSNADQYYYLGVKARIEKLLHLLLDDLS